MLENTKHNGRGYLIEVEPIGKEIKIENKFKAEKIKVVRKLTIPEFLETLSPDDNNEWNRLLRAAKVGLETLSPDDSEWRNRLLRATKVGDWDTIFKTL
jgi:hypothetical protein